MTRIIFGVIVGFIAWTILWIGSDQVLIMLSPGWYGAHQLSFELAMHDGTPFAPDTTIMLMHLVREVLISLMAGFLAAFVAGENRKAPLALGILLFLFGAGVEIYAWHYIPLWYHAVFLVLLIPATMIGGRLRSSAAVR